MRTCPKCRVVSPDSALVCDCGYSFDPSAQKGPSGRGVPNPGALAKIGACIGGFLVGAAPVAMIAQFFNLQAERPGLRFFGAMTGAGILGAVGALALLKRESRSRRR